MSKQTLILDSSQIQSYLECPQLWKYSRVDNIVPADSKTEEHSPPAIQGSYGHKLLERYYKKIAVGATLAEAMDWALSVKADQICECGHEIADHAVLNQNAIDRLLDTAISECTSVGCTCTNPIPSKVEITKPEKDKVANRFRDYCYTYSANEFKPPSPEAVEVGFSYPLYEDDDYYFVLEGKMDLFSPERKGTIYSFVDHKFQLRERNLYKKSIQFRNYGLVSAAKIAMINYIRLKEKLDKNTLLQVPITYAVGEHAWWKQKLIGYYKDILRDINVEKQFGLEMPKNWGMCSGMFGYECDYTQLCNERDPEIKGRMQSQLFKIKPEWKPWQKNDPRTRQTSQYFNI